MLGIIKRSSDVLALFTVDASEWGVRDIARQLEVPKSSAHEVLSSLAAAGFLERTGASRYRLGWRILSLGQTLIEGASFRAPALAAMRRLARETGCSATLDVWDRAETLCIGVQCVDGGGPASSVGERRPVLETASGLVLLAERSWHERAQVVVETNVHDLQSRLAFVRARQHARRTSHCDSGWVELATPVRDEHDGVVAALGLVGPAADLVGAPARFDAALTSAAAEVHRSLGLSHDDRAEVPA